MVKWEYVGRKKLGLVIVLILAAIICALLSELYVKPNLAQDQKTLKHTEAELNQVKAKTLDIEDELAFTKDESNKARFEALEVGGFFANQQRDIVEASLDEAKRISGILGGNFKVSPPSCLVNSHLKDSKYVLLSSSIVIDTESYEDLSIYNFVDLFIRKLPGYVVIENIKVDRVEDVTRFILQEIGTGMQTPLVASNITMSWYTIINKEAAVCSERRTR